MKFWLFIQAIEVTPTQGVKITAANGGHDGPPLLVWFVQNHQAEAMHIGQQVSVVLDWTVT